MQHITCRVTPVAGDVRPRMRVDVAGEVKAWSKLVGLKDDVGSYTYVTAPIVELIRDFNSRNPDGAKGIRGLVRPMRDKPQHDTNVPEDQLSESFNRLLKAQIYAHSADYADITDVDILLALRHAEYHCELMWITISEYLTRGKYIHTAVNRRYFRAVHSYVWLSFDAEHVFDHCHASFRRHPVRPDEC